MLQICILGYIIVELFEWSSTLYGIKGSKDGLTKFQYKLYKIEITYSYILSIILGSIGFGLTIKFADLHNLIMVAGCFFVTLWVRDIISSFLVKLFMTRAYKWYQKGMIENAKKKVK